MDYFKSNYTLLCFYMVFKKQKDIYKSFFDRLNNDRQQLFLNILENNEIPEDILIEFNKYAKSKNIHIIFNKNIKEDFSSCMFLLRYFNNLQFIENIDNLLKQ